MVFATLLTTALLALAASVAAEPIIVKKSHVSLPISRRINLNGQTILEHDQLRAKALRANGEAAAEARAAGVPRAVISSPAENQAVDYIASVGVGSPATQYNLIIDTGSSNTWVGAGKAYVKTSTSIQTANSVSVTYGSGSFSGTEFLDQVTIATGLVITNQSIGVASKSTGFSGVDGIIGIGPVDLTVGTLSPATRTPIPTVTDMLFSEGKITADEVSVSFEPLTEDDQVNGELTWGGTDSTKFTGSITFAPITGTSPADEFWGINESIEYGSTTILANTAGIVDTGTTLILIASNAFSKYEKDTGGKIDENTGLLKITSAQFAALENLTFVISGVSFVLTPNGQIWPRAFNTLIGGVAGDIYLIVGNIGTPSGSGLDFIDGQAFIERFYCVFDTANKRVGFATTSFTDATTN